MGKVTCQNEDAYFLHYRVIISEKVNLCMVLYLLIIDFKFLFISLFDNQFYNDINI